MGYLDRDLLPGALIRGAKDGGHTTTRNYLVEVVMVE
jgi:hypothetical protein